MLMFTSVGVPASYAQTLSVIQNDTVTRSDTLDPSTYSDTTYWVKCHTFFGAAHPVTKWSITVNGAVRESSDSCNDTQMDVYIANSSSIGFILSCTAQDGTDYNCGSTEMTSGREGHSLDYSRDVRVFTAPGHKASATIPDRIELGQNTFGETVEISLPVTVDPEGANLDVGQGLASGGALHIPLTDDKGIVHKDDLTATTTEGIVTNGHGMDFKKSGTIVLKWKPSGSGKFSGALVFKLSVM